MIYQEHDINKIFTTFLNIFVIIFEASFPKIYHVKQKDNAWITKGIRISCQRKRSLYILSRNSDDVKLKTYYKHYCSILRKTIREAKKKLYYNELILSSENKVKMSWKIIRKLTRKTQPTFVFPTFKVDSVEQSPIHIAVAFNSHFLNITGSLDIHIAKDSDPLSLLKKSHPSVIPPIQTVPISEGDIKSIISSLKSKNSSSYDGIPTKILKLCRNQVSKPLAFIFNKSISMGIFPE